MKYFGALYVGFRSFFCLIVSAGILSWCLSGPAYGQTLKPVAYWTFDGKEPGVDRIAGKTIDTRYYNCRFKVDSGRIGNSISLENKNCVTVTGALKGNVVDEFSIEFLFKGSRFTFTTFSSPHMVIRFDYNGFLFRTTHEKSGQNYIDQFIVPLKGAGRQSYNYYVDGAWHHIVFTASLKDKRKEIWVDGECRKEFFRPISAGDSFLFSGNDGFRNTDYIDELAFYDKMLSPRQIEQHYNDISSGVSYTFSSRAPVSRKMELSFSEDFTANDTCEFAPGYPDYDVQVVDQLNFFPLPRFNNHQSVNRNMSWMDINYLHRELPGKGGKGFGKVSPKKAVELSLEMAKNWNYYIDIPLLRVTAKDAERQYSDKKTVPGALIDFANRHPQYPMSVITHQGQIRPVHAGFTSQRPNILSQALPDKYYLRNANAQPVILSNRKWLSPLMPLDIIDIDGKTSRFYLDQLMKYLRNTPQLINENGEVFGHIRKEALLKTDPAVWADYKQSGLSEGQYSGKFQFKIDSTYKAAVMRGFDAQNTRFSFYGLSAFNAAYWPDYKYRRSLNRWNADTILSTPDFYPRFPENWHNKQGAFNGFGPIAEGRVREIALGDKVFSPFVAAGWGEEEKNIRPAQWLALLKGMVMLGADFFYTGYFNVTGSGGKWPNGVGPYDPRGYAYQIAMPVYAQAIKSWAPGFFLEGELLNPAKPNDPVKQYRFEGKGENELILVRKWGHKYLVYGSIQPNSNVKGNVPEKKMTTIDLEGRQLSFEIRRQGSMYVLDVEDKDTVWYQLDGWHQYEHPYFWNRDIVQEAEIYSGSRGPVKLVTDNPDQEPGFSGTTTYCHLNKGGGIFYHFPVRDNITYRLSVKIKAADDSKKTLVIQTSDKESGSVDILNKDWKWYEVPVVIQAGSFIDITSLSDGVLIDKFRLAPE